MGDSSDSGDDRNPSPPRELLEASDDIQNADKVGDTLFSKHWVCQTLMKLIKDVERHQECSEQSEESNTGYDVEENLQDELCELWDMSANPDVASFLLQYEAIDILSAVISKSKAPRATEICVGILGNLACKEEICSSMTNKEGFIDLILMLLEGADAPTLVESTRLVFACISSNDEVSKSWREAIMKSDIVHKSLVFIISSSTNNDLLKNAGELLDKLMDIDEELCSQWATEELVGALLETLNQIKNDEGNNDTLATYLHVLQLISTCQNGVKSLSLHLEPVYSALCSYLSRLCNEDEILGLDGREGPLAAAISVINVLITVPGRGYLLLEKDHDLVRCVLKILEALYPRLRTERQSSSEHKEEQEKDSHSGSHVDHHAKYAVTNQHGNPDTQAGNPTENHGGQNVSENTKESETQSKIGSDQHNETGDGGHVTGETEDVTSSPDHVTSGLLFGLIQSVLVDLVDMSARHLPETRPDKPPTFLSYLSEHCPRSRLKALLLCLNTKNETETNSETVKADMIQTLVDIAKFHQLNRLTEIIENFSE